jgi:Primase X
LTTIIHQQSELDNQAIEGLDFILSHLETFCPQFPRTISTKTTSNRQILVANKQEALARFKQSIYLDCRINAYLAAGNPKNVREKPAANAPISFLFIDLDSAKTVFEELDKALTLTLDNIKERLNGNPTVLWTGNGYHIYQPLQDFNFSSKSHFNKFECVNKFLRYAAIFLSNNNSDKNNYQSPKSCMLRFPGTLNSKCLNTDNSKDPEVKIIQRWGGIRPNVTGLLANFYAYLTDEKIKEERYSRAGSGIRTNVTNFMAWIDLLLKRPIADFRKIAISLILVPYLITIKQLQPVETINQIKEWLEECNKLRRLDFNPNYRITAAISHIQKTGLKPMRFDILKTRNKELCDLLSIQ